MAGLRRWTELFVNSCFCRLSTPQNSKRIQTENQLHEVQEHHFLHVTYKTVEVLTPLVKGKVNITMSSWMQLVEYLCRVQFRHRIRCSW